MKQSNRSQNNTTRGIQTKNSQNQPNRTENNNSKTSDRTKAHGKEFDGLF